MKNKIISIFQSSDTDEKSLGFIINAIYRSTKSKMNYIRFKISQEDIRALNDDEVLAIKSTYLALESIGYKKKDLVSSVNDFKKILVNEKSAFDTALEKQMNVRVLSKKQNIEKYKLAIQKAKDEISKMEARIHELNKSIHSADNDALQAEKKIKLQGENFNKTYKSVLSKIDSDLNNYTNLL